jgi:hypothetical protein
MGHVLSLQVARVTNRGGFGKHFTNNKGHIAYRTIGIQVH